jgi:hypothetical protein
MNVSSCVPNNPSPHITVNAIVLHRGYQRCAERVKCLRAFPVVVSSANANSAAQLDEVPGAGLPFSITRSAADAWE